MAAARNALGRRRAERRGTSTAPSARFAQALAAEAGRAAGAFQSGAASPKSAATRRRRNANTGRSSAPPEQLQGGVQPRRLLRSSSDDGRLRKPPTARRSKRTASSREGYFYLAKLLLDQRAAVRRSGRAGEEGTRSRRRTPNTRRSATTCWRTVQPHRTSCGCRGGGRPRTCGRAEDGHPLAICHLPFATDSMPKRSQTLNSPTPSPPIIDGAGHPDGDAGGAAVREDGRSGGRRGALPLALARLGHRVTIVLPRYRGIDTDGTPSTAADVPFGAQRYPVAFVEQRRRGRRRDRRARRRAGRSSIATGSTATRRATSPTTRSASRCSAAARSNTRGCADADRRSFTRHDWQAGARAGVPAHGAARRSGARRRPHRVHDPQPGVPGTVRSRGAARGSASAAICSRADALEFWGRASTSRAASSSATRSRR